MISKIRLRGWRSHLDSEFSFSKGMNALVGIMGSGKSSVMDGVSFALFGTLPVVQGRKILLEDLIMNTPQQKEEASVELEFSSGGKKYNIVRGIKRGRGSSAEIREEGELKEVGPRGVTKEVERLLEMDYEVFSRAVYSEQNGLDYFLKIPGGQRRQHIDRMLRLDTFEMVRSETVGLQGKVKAGREERAKIVVDLEKEGVEGKVKEVEQEISTLKKRGEELEKEKEGVAKKREALEKQVSRFEDNDKELQNTLRLLEGLKGGLEEISSREGKCRKIVRGRDLGKIDKDLTEVDKDVSSRKEQLDSLKGEVHDNMARKKVTEEGLDQVGDIKGSCPLCESEISGEKKATLISSREKEVEELEEEIAKAHRIVFERAKKLTELEKELETKRVERERVSQAFKEIKELEGKLGEIMEVKGKYEEKISQLRETLKGMDLSQMREEMEGLASRLSSMETEVSGLQERVKDKELMLKELGERKEMLEQYRRELEKEGAIIKQLGNFQSALRQTQEELRTVFLGNVNSIMDNIWNDVYPYNDIDSARLGLVNGDYVLQVKRGGWVDADSVSGGERSLAALTLRIAFSLAFLPNLKWLILDEPTHNLDNNVISSFATVLREKIPTFAEQVFLITHDPALSEGLDNVYRLERNKDANEPTRVLGS